MHIAIDARNINTTTGRYIERLLHHLEQIDTTNNYSILVPTKDLSYWKPSSPNFVLHAADFPNYSLAEQTGFNTFLKHLAPDLVHFCMPQQPAFYPGIHVTTFHDLTLVKTYNSDKNWLVYHAKQFMGAWVFKRVAKSSQQIITVSNFSKKELLEFTGIPEDKVTVTYEAADITTTASRRYKLPFKQYLLYVGQQSDYKNIKRLGDAHQKLLAKYPNLGLVLAGRLNASARINQDYFTKQGYQNIIFTDFVEDDRLNWLYAHASVYVFPSLMEGFGLPGLEVMAHGTPLVSSNATCLPEIYGQAAHYFNPTDVDDMVHAIDDVLVNERLRLRLVNNGFKQLKKYSWKKMAEQTHRVYMDALKAKN